MKIDNGTGGSRETSTGKPARVDERGRESINFFAELKRRNVYKVAVAYAIVGWLLVQVATQVFPFFEIPNWAVRLVVLAIIIAFPIALVVAWAFELTPEGIKRTESADEMPRTRQHAWIYVVIVAATLSVALFFLGRYTATNKEKETDAAASDKSIAVLPFENATGDANLDYLSDGVSESVIDRLSQLPQLKVIARSSSFQYRKPSDLKAVAHTL